MDLKSKIILISGPTASGKSKFALKLAKKIDGEIINADSMQIYKECKILSARPSKKDQTEIKHHLYGFQSVKKNFSTGQWINLCLKKIQEIKKKNKVPIVVGGTGLYFKSLVCGIAKIPSIPLSFRNNIIKTQKKIGQKNFYNKLIKIDPLVKKKISLNDINRSIRAYEVKKKTKISIYEWQKKTKKFFKDEDFLKIYFDYSKKDLEKKINKRVDKMLKIGAIKEARKILNLKLNKLKSANYIIGIKEIDEYINNKIPNKTILKDRIIFRTMRYVKRQLTWSRGNMQEWKKLKSSDFERFFNL